MALPAPLQNIKTITERLTLQQKIALIGAGALVMTVIWVAVYLSNRVDYQVVFSDLQPAEAQSIIQKLQELKVPYELSTDGRSISVASEKASEVRIQLASQGLPSSGRIGFEIFDQTNFGLTNFQEQVNYQRALEGELARSIMTLSEVEAARVHLVLPKESLFQSPEDQTKASVILKLKAGRSLSDGAVSGIVNVIASSVKGLTPERVTLIDYRGKVLAQPESGGSLTGQQLDERLKLENELSTKIVQILEPAVGQGKVRPQVSVNMAFAQVEETTEKFDPQGAVVRSQQKQEERQPQPRPVGGIPGPKGGVGTPNQLPTDARLPATPAPAATSAAAAATSPAPAQPVDNASTKQSETVNYEISKSVRHTVEPVGTVKSVSVAVIIDNHTKVTNGQNGKPQTSSEPRTAEDMKKYRDIVAAAVGFNPDRGDKLTVENVSFEDESELLKEPTFVEKQGPLLLTGLRYLIIPIAFVLIYLLFLRPVKKVVFATLSPAAAGAGQLAAGQMVKALPQASGTRAQAPMTVKQLEAQISGAAPEPPAPNPALDLEPLDARTKMEEIRDRVVDRAKQDPENVARLVRVWLSEDKK